MITPVKDSVMFDKLMCCSLYHGFRNNPNTVRVLMRVVNKDLLRKLANIFSPNTNYTIFPLIEVERLIYGQIANDEIGRIQGGEDCHFPCKEHTPGEHMKGLRNVAALMSTGKVLRKSLN